ncbi:uncharacterized protein LOC129723474 [Wyeomyia smithii]|uniref:uncharacterized protein LOC129723474 n=1 Tax=Wyeomyia smithii TaxID=174621 RepID=UPI002467AE05|nr:uncharacterized protein LOC129723474 [Wyeomyia smithii]
MAGHNLNDERERSADVEFDRSLQFSSMFLSEQVLRGLTRNNYIHPSPIQARAIPLGKLGIDLLVQAKSGTGKTLVFAVLITEMHCPDVLFPQSLTIVPTREIAVQIEQVLNRIGYSVPSFRARSFIGGMDITQDRKNMQNCSAVIGTPGRILHLIKNNILNTTAIRVLVLDEADSLITGTLQSDVDHIINSLPVKRQTVMCSATFYQNRDRKLLKYLNEKFIGVTPKKEVPVLHGIRQFVRELPDAKDNIKEVMGKIAELNQILKKVPYNQCLVFTNTQTKADTYRGYLNRAGWQAEVIRSGQEQRVRLKTVENLREFRCRILIATDLLARGIDAENVNLVINVDVPKDNSIYLHRIGRAGRFGTKGISITLLSSAKDTERFRKILHDIGGPEMFVYQLPSADIEEIWNFDQYAKYGKIYASTLEQEIRERGADKSLLETIQEVDSRTEIERKSSENLEDSLEEASKKRVDSVLEADSIEQMLHKKELTVTTADEQEETVERIISLDAGAMTVTAEVDTQKQSVDPKNLSNVAFDQTLVDDGFECDDLNSDTHPNSVEEIGSQINADNLFTDNDNNLCETKSSTYNGILQLKDEETQKIISVSVSNGNGSSKVDELFLAAMHKLQLADTEECTSLKTSPIGNESFAESKCSHEIDQIFPEAISDLEQQNLIKTENTFSIEVKAEFAGEKTSANITGCSHHVKRDVDVIPEILLATVNGELDSKKKSVTDDLFLAAMNKIDFGDEVKPRQDAQDQSLPSLTPSSPEISCSTPESCFTTDSSFSSNTTKKVEVGSDFTTPNSRVQGIRSAVPAHQVSSSASDSSSDTSQTSDPVVPMPDQNCLPLEVNNDALFAKIMEQKEMEVGHQQRPFQFSIDGCSLEVHDDPVSDRDIDSRKGSVPDVVPCGITMDPSRLHNQPTSTMDEQAASGFDLNSNTCGSNHGSVFEHEEEIVIPQDDPPKRIRFQEDDLSLDLLVNSENAFELEAQIEQQQDPRLDLAPRTDARAATEDIEDASSYSSEYDSEMSNSSFFDQREWDREEISTAVAEAEGKSGRSRNARKSSARNEDRTILYHRIYANWSNQYWNQMTMIRDYTRYSSYTRRNICHNCQPKR